MLKPGNTRFNGEDILQRLEKGGLAGGLWSRIAFLLA